LEFHEQAIGKLSIQNASNGHTSRQEFSNSREAFQTNITGNI